MTARKVLVAEDDPLSLRVVQSMLRRWGYEPVAAHDGVEAWNILQAEDAPRIAILDWLMPHRDGLDVCCALRQPSERPYVYILMLSARVQDVVEGLEAGADDYLTKPFEAEELRARLYAGERILRVQQQLVDARECLRTQAIRDPLTGLFNRRHMQESFDRELQRAAHGKESVAVLMFDLDHFKRLNDTSGHEAGDLFLKEIGALMEARTRREDIPCRYGGEEFVLILPGVSLDVALRRAEALRQAVREITIEFRGTTLAPATVSIGVACYPDHGITQEELLRAADSALYCAKDRGRDRAVAYQGAAAPSVAVGL